MRQLKYLAMVSLLICCISSCSNKSKKYNGDSSQSDEKKTEKTTQADHEVKTETYPVHANKVYDN